jgi:hypothetical protein
LRQATEFTEDLQLQFLWHAGQLRRACRIKDDLKRPHRIAARLAIPPPGIKSEIVVRNPLYSIEKTIPEFPRHSIESSPSGLTNAF